MQLSQLHHSDTVAILAPAGRLDATTVAAFRQAVIARLTSGIVRIVVDCREITFIDSAAPRPQVLGLLMVGGRSPRLHSSMGLGR